MDRAFAAFDEAGCAPLRTAVGISGVGVVYAPRGEPALDPSGRYLFVRRELPSGSGEDGALDLEAAGEWIGEEVESLRTPVGDPPDLFPAAPLPTAPPEWPGAETRSWPSTPWTLAVERSGQRRVFRFARGGEVLEPLGRLGSSSARWCFDPRGRRMAVFEPNPEGGTTVSWLALDPTQDEALSWSEDETGVAALAREQDRLVFAFLRIPGRSLAQYMQSRCLDDPRVRVAVRSIALPLRVDTRTDPERFERLFGERGALGCALLTPAGETVALWRGYAEPEPMLAFLETVAALWPRWRVCSQRHRECPGDPDVAIAFAEACWQGGDANTAEEILRGVLVADDARARAAAHARCARIEIDRGRVLASLQHLAAWHALVDPQQRCADPGVALTEALIARARRRPDQAARVLELSLREDASEELPQRLLVLSMAWHDSGDSERGRNGLRTLAQRYPGTDWADQAEACLQHAASPHSHTPLSTSGEFR